MNKKEFLKEIEEQTQINKKIIEQIFVASKQKIIELLQKGESLNIKGIAKIFAKEYIPKTYINLKTGEKYISKISVKAKCIFSKKINKML